MSNSQDPYAPVDATPSVHGMKWTVTDSASLSKTAIGLSLVYYGIILFLLSTILTFGAAFFPFALMITLGGFMISSVMMLVGPIFCLSVPAETNAKGLIIGAVVLQLLNFSITVLSAAGVNLGPFAPFAQMFGVLPAICFVLFMRRLSQFIGREDLASRAGRVLMLGLVTVVAAIGRFFAMFTLGPAAALLLLGVAAMMLIAFVMYANLVNALSKALTSND